MDFWVVVTVWLGIEGFGLVTCRQVGRISGGRCELVLRCLLAGWGLDADGYRGISLS